MSEANTGIKTAYTSIKEARKSIGVLIEETNKKATKAGYAKLKPTSGIMLLFLVFGFGAFLVYNNNGSYLSDAFTGALLFFVVAGFLVYGFYSTHTITPQSTQAYSNEEMNRLIRDTVGELPEIQRLSDSELNAHFDPLREYMETPEGNKYSLDEKKYAEFLAARGTITDEDVVALLFDIQQLYFARQKIV